jgi:hypothetical protein
VRGQPFLPWQRPRSVGRTIGDMPGGQLLVQPHPRAFRAGEEDRQPIERQLVERRFAGGAQPHPDRRPHAALFRQAERRDRPGEAMYSASAISIGSICTSCAVRNSQLVWSSVPSRLRSSVPAGSIAPCGMPRSVGSGLNCTTAIDGVGAR